MPLNVLRNASDLFKNFIFAKFVPGGSDSGGSSSSALPMKSSIVIGDHLNSEQEEASFVVESSGSSISYQNRTASFDELLNRHSNQTTLLGLIIADPLILREIIWAYVMPLICLFGLVTNSINVLVYSNRTKLKNSIYKYLFAHSIVELVYLLLSFVYFLMKFILNNEYNYYYFPRWYALYIYLYLASVIALFLMFIELTVSLKRLFIITNFNLTFKLKFKYVLLILLVVSVLINTPIAFHKYVEEYSIDDRLASFSLNSNTSSNQTFEVAADCIQKSRRHRFYYELVLTDMGRTSLFKFISFMTFFFRGVLAPLILLFINIIIAKKFRQQLDKKARMTKVNLTPLLEVAADDTFQQQQQQQQQLNENPTLTSTNGVGSKSLTSRSSQAAENISLAAQNITKMLIIVNFISIFANLAISATFMLRFTFDLKSRVTTFSLIASTIFLYLSHSVSLFIYYNYDKLFCDIFNCLFKRQTVN